MEKHSEGRAEVKRHLARLAGQHLPGLDLHFAEFCPYLGYGPMITKHGDLVCLYYRDGKCRWHYFEKILSSGVWGGLWTKWFHKDPDCEVHKKPEG